MASDKVEANGPSIEPDIAADACDVVFSSTATNLVKGLPPESTGFFDVFYHRHKGFCPVLCIGPEIVDITDAVQSGENTLDMNILLANGREYDNTRPVDLLPYTILALKLYVY